MLIAKPFKADLCFVILGNREKKKTNYLDLNNHFGHEALSTDH